MVFSFILLFWVLFFILNFEWGEFGSKFWYYLCFLILLQYIFIIGYLNIVKVNFKFGVNVLILLELLVNEIIFMIKDEMEEIVEIVKWQNKIIYFFEIEEIY